MRYDRPSIPKRTPGAETLIADRDELPLFTSSPTSYDSSWDVMSDSGTSRAPPYNLVSGEHERIVVLELSLTASRRDNCPWPRGSWGSRGHGRLKRRRQE